MGDWFGYALSDFLLFSSETYWRLFARMNAELWPLHILIVPVTAVLAVWAGGRWRNAGLVVGLGLAAAWVLVVQVFFSGYYVNINWAVASLIPLGWLQAALLLILAPGLHFSRTGRMPLAFALLALALAYPLVGLISGRPFLQSEVAGLAPDPTAILTLGILGLATPGWRRLCLALLPACWCAVSAVTLLTMATPSGWVLVAALGCALAGFFAAVRRLPLHSR